MNKAIQYFWRVPKAVLFAVLLAGLPLLINSCKPDDDNNKPAPPAWQDTPYEFKRPDRFPPPVPTPNNPLTVNGVALGRKLFYEPMLSGNNTQACAGCHAQANSFSDAPNALSKGIDGMTGDKNAMALINLAWNRDFFWDGRRATLEEQILDPVPNMVEMHQTWKAAVAKLQNDPEYPPLFKKAFNTETVDSLLVAKAIAQFLRTITVSETKFQKFLNGKAQLTAQELRGFNLFMSDDGADCFHCHPIADGLMTDNYFENPVQRFHNNGLEPAPAAGELTARAKVTGNAGDNGKFKVPTLLNIAYTAPYMHDGRFKTLEEVVDFYNSGVHLSSTLDPNMNMKPIATRRFFDDDGIRHLNLNEFEKADLIAFLKTLSEPSINTNPAFSKP